MSRRFRQSETAARGRRASDTGSTSDGPQRLTQYTADSLPGGLDAETVTLQLICEGGVVLRIADPVVVALMLAAPP
jgi:hypothetical protein